MNDTTITLVGLDVTDPTDLDRAATVIRSLHHRAKDRTGDVRIEFDNGVAVVEFTSKVDAAPSVGADVIEVVYGAKTQSFLDSMVATIRYRGETTLEEAAQAHGISIDTARAYIRNAGRTSKARGVPMPIKSRWDTDRGRSVYTVA